MTRKQVTAIQDEARIAGNAYCVTIVIFRDNFTEFVSISDFWVGTMRIVEALWGRAAPEPLSFRITVALQSFLAQKIEAFVTLIRHFIAIVKLFCLPAGVFPVHNLGWRWTENHCGRDTRNSNSARTSHPRGQSLFRYSGTMQLHIPHLTRKLFEFWNLDCAFKDVAILNIVTLNVVTCRYSF